MNPAIEELYDYVALRQMDQAVMMVVEVDRPVVVLGGSQSPDVIESNLLHGLKLRRRRGGGGLVLLQPGDKWVDWWIPSDDPRWTNDVRLTSMLVGSWWLEVLRPLVQGEVSVHSGALEGRAEYRVACFAGIGPGEVLVGDRKAVGVTQWRVREGAFVSSVLHAAPSDALLDILVERPAGLREALVHHTISTLALESPQGLVDALESASGAWSVRHITLAN